MKWGSKEPCKEGWYLVTTYVGRTKTVMPAYRMEYPKGNFTWQNISNPGGIIASIRFPKPYQKEATP